MATRPVVARTLVAGAVVLSSLDQRVLQRSDRYDAIGPAGLLWRRHACPQVPAVGRRGTGEGWRQEPNGEPTGRREETGLRHLADPGADRHRHRLRVRVHRHRRSSFQTGRGRHHLICLGTGAVLRAPRNPNACPVADRAGRRRERPQDERNAAEGAIRTARPIWTARSIRTAPERAESFCQAAGFLVGLETNYTVWFWLEFMLTLTFVPVLLLEVGVTCYQVGRLIAPVASRSGASRSGYV